MRKNNEKSPLPSGNSARGCGLHHEDTAIIAHPSPEIKAENSPEDRKPGYWAVIPAKVRYDPELRPNAKLLYAEISALSNAAGYCWATNDYFAKLFHLSQRTISDLISELDFRGYVTVEILRDPNNNEVTGRRIWIDVPSLVRVSHPPIEENFHRGMEENCYTPIEENFQQNNINNNTNPPKAPQRGAKRSREPKSQPEWKPERFAGFWDYYRTHGRGESKQAAIRAWDKLRPDDALIATMGRALKAQAKSESWQQGIGIPYASTWLNNARWEDQVKATPAPAPQTVVDREAVPEW